MIPDTDDDLSCKFSCGCHAPQRKLKCSKLENHPLIGMTIQVQKKAMEYEAPNDDNNDALDMPYLMQPLMLHRCDAIPLIERMSDSVNNTYDTSLTITDAYTIPEINKTIFVFFNNKFNEVSKRVTIVQLGEKYYIGDNYGQHYECDEVCININ